MMIIVALVLRRASRIMPRERIIGGSVALMHIVVDSRARSPRGIVQRRVYRAFCAYAFPVSGPQRTPTAVRVMQAFRALLERSARRGAFVFISFSQHKPADPPGAVNRLVRR